jgi:hypothetical protein
MAFDNMSFVLNYPLNSTNTVTNNSAYLAPSGTGLLKISFYDGTEVGAEDGSYILTKSGVKLVSELTVSDYVSFWYPAQITGQFKETVQYQSIREFLVHDIGLAKQVSSVSSLGQGYGLSSPVYRTPENGGTSGEDYPCVCVLFNDSCGTRMTTTTFSIEQLEN